jgi:hypothetical protein
MHRCQEWWPRKSSFIFRTWLGHVRELSLMTVKLTRERHSRGLTVSWANLWNMKLTVHSHVLVIGNSPKWGTLESVRFPWQFGEHPRVRRGCTATTSSKSLQLENSNVYLDTKPPEHSLLVVFFKILSYSFCRPINIVCRARCLTEWSASKEIDECKSWNRNPTSLIPFSVSNFCVKMVTSIFCGWMFDIVGGG